MDFKGKKITVMGLGLFGGGLGVTKFLVEKGAQVTVTDLRGKEDLKESVQALAGLPLKLRLGRHEEKDFQAADMIVVNPAVPKSSPFLKVAKQRGVPIETEINLLFRLCRAPIIGVTGTNGKTTTVALIGDMLRRVDPRTALGGNIGGSLLNRIEGLQSNTPVVVELSSFQLEDLQVIGKSPHIAVVTNLTPNHLDRHSTMENYIKAKKGIIIDQTSQDVAILNYDDSIVRDWEKDCNGEVLFFSTQRRPDQGVFFEDGEIIIKRGGRQDKICRGKELALPGAHNLQNALAAAGAAWIYGTHREAIAETLRTFKGVEHRLEFVREIDGVKYYNDSIATTPEATIAALNSFEEEIILIAGGYDKGIPFNQVAQVIAAKVKSLLLIGNAAEKIASLVAQKRGKTQIQRCSSLQEAVSKARTNSQKGDVVLMSPACASYDMFRNFRDRGEQFKRLVQQM